jgi:tetratricopeptide (TPR) repeat protein
MLINKKILTLSFLILAASFIAYLPSLRNDFVWDDKEVIQKSHFLYKASSIKNIIIPQEREYKKARYYRPVHYASIVLDKYIWGVESLGFHLSNIIFHAINSLLFFYLFRLLLIEFRIKDPELTSFLGSLLFVFHPIHTESVSWIAGRTDMLCTMFFLLALISHILVRKNLLFLPFVIISYSLSLLSKEIGIAFPFVALSLDYLNKNLKRKNLIIYISYILITCLYIYLRGRAFINVPDLRVLKEGSVGYSSLFTFIEPIKLLFNSYFFYIYKLLFPIELNAFIANVPFGLYYTSFSIITLLAISAITFYYGFKKDGILLFSFLFFIFTLAPSATVALSKIAVTPLAERYLYLPSIGFIIMLTCLILKLRTLLSKKFVLIMYAVLVLSYLFLCINRQTVWKNSISLWKDTSRKSFLSPIPHTNYGTALLDSGQYEDAIKEFNIALSPKLGDSKRGKAITSINLGNTYIELKKYKLAEKWFFLANKFDPSYGKTYYHLGLINYIKAEIYSSKKHYKLAEKYLMQTFQYYHSYSKAHLLLARVYIGLGDKAGAKKQAGQALKIGGLSNDLSKDAEDIIKIDNQGSYKNPEKNSYR